MIIFFQKVWNRYFTCNTKCRCVIPKTALDSLVETSIETERSVPWKEHFEVVKRNMDLHFRMACIAGVYDAFSTKNHLDEELTEQEKQQRRDFTQAVALKLSKKK